MKYKISLLLISLLIYSCSDKKDFETYLKFTGIKLVDAYITDSIKQGGFNDWTLESWVKITDRDKKKIIDKLRGNINFPKVISEKEYYDSIYQKGDSLNGFIIASKYYYGIYKRRYAKIRNQIEAVGYETYDLSLDTTANNLYFKYEYE